MVFPNGHGTLLSGRVAACLRDHRKGEWPAFPINLKTAKALGLTVPPELLATADEVIE
jgi:hypothetical protein